MTDRDPALRFALRYGDRLIPLAMGENTVGRSPRCDVCLQTVTVSRQHLKIHVSPEGVTVTDLGSRNGTWLNRLRLKPGTPTPVTPRDRIFLPAVELRVVELDGDGHELEPGSAGTTVPDQGPTRPQPFVRCPSAGAARRLTATFIDMAVFLMLSAILAIPAWLGFPGLPEDRNLVEGLTTLTGDHQWMMFLGTTLLAWILLWFLYFILGWGLFGATPGQFLLGLRVVDYRFRYPIGPSRAFLRLVAYCIGSVPFMAGHLLVIGRSDNRALHDMLAGTRVIRMIDIMDEGARRRDESEEEPTGDSGESPGSDTVEETAEVPCFR